MQSTQAVISLEKIISNAEAVTRAAGKPIIAVVKDDAYGHGAVKVAHALAKSVSAFAVATAAEGAELRIGGIDGEILVLSPAVTREEAERIAAYGLTASVTSFSALHLLACTGVQRAHLAVNTGMNRYGVRPELVSHACREALKAGLSLEGVYSHLYAPELDADTHAQKELFSAACDAVRIYFPAASRHLSATGGLLAGDGFDLVRAGISLYGYLPDGFENAIALQPAMRLYGYVSHACTPVGDGAGYGRATARYRSLRTVRAGYGDGLFRAGLKGGVGTLCMDATIMRGRGHFGRKKLLVSDFQTYARERGVSVYEALLRAGSGADKRYE